VEEVRGLQRGMRIAEGNVENGSAFSFLKSLRRVAPDSKDWG